MKLSKTILKQLVLDEIKGLRLNEEITNDDMKEIREIIRKEVADIFFSLFKKRKMWGA